MNKKEAKRAKDRLYYEQHSFWDDKVSIENPNLKPLRTKSGKGLFRLSDAECKAILDKKVQRIPKRPKKLRKFFRALYKYDGIRKIIDQKLHISRITHWRYMDQLEGIFAEELKRFDEICP